LRDLVQPEPALQNEICLVLLDDSAKPVTISRANFRELEASVRRHRNRGGAAALEIAAYLVNPAQLTQAARSAASLSDC